MKNVTAIEISKEKKYIEVYHVLHVAELPTFNDGFVTDGVPGGKIISRALQSHHCNCCTTTDIAQRYNSWAT